MNALAANFGLADVRQHAPSNLTDRKSSIGSVVHEVPPSSRPDNGDDEAAMKPPTNGRNPETLRHQTRTALREALRVHVTDPSKVVARKVGKSPESIDAYRQINVPAAWADMVEFCRRYPAFGLQALELMGFDIDRDRDSYAMFLSLMKQARGE